MVPTSINDNRTFNDSRSRWQNNNQGNAISGHFNSGGYSIVDGNIIFNPGGGINVGNQYSTQNQNDYNQGMYGGAGGSGVEAVKSSNDAEAARVQQKQQAVNTENANNANKIITAQQESNSQYQSNKTAAVNEAMSVTKLRVKLLWSNKQLTVKLRLQRLFKQGQMQLFYRKKWTKTNSLYQKHLKRLRNIEKAQSTPVKINCILIRMGGIINQMTILL
jgi:hypothetical protein